MSRSGSVRRELSRQARLRAVNRIWCTAEKFRRGCELSGTFCDPELLEWHHPNMTERRKWISRLYDMSPVGLRREINRCICVHREVHRAIHRAGVGEWLAPMSFTTNAWWKSHCREVHDRLHHLVSRAPLITKDAGL
jgi:hypothetical protein